MRTRSSSTKPLVQIGKQGVTRGIVEAIDSHLERMEIVKVRVLKTGLKERDVKDISREIIEKTGSDLVEIRGHTFVLHRRKGRS
jgi:RNA-binding protein